MSLTTLILTNVALDGMILAVVGFVMSTRSETAPPGPASRSSDQASHRASSLRSRPNACIAGGLSSALPAHPLRHPAPAPPGGGRAPGVARMAAVSESNLERVRRGFEAARRGNLDALRELLDPDVTWHGAEGLTADSCHGREDVLRFIENAARRGAIGELVDVVAAGEDVVVVMRPQPPEDGSQAPLRRTSRAFATATLSS